MSTFLTLLMFLKNEMTLPCLPVASSSSRSYNEPVLGDWVRQRGDGQMKKHFCLALGMVSLAFLLAGCPNDAYVFTPDEITAIAQAGVGLAPEDGIKAILDALLAKYPDLIRPSLKWHFNYTGGTLGEMALLYASTREYILIFGTPIGAEGFSGRYAEMDVYDNMFAGEMWTYLEGETEKTVYEPGDCAILLKGEAKGYLMKEGTWMLEYTRGNIPAALPIGTFGPTALTLDLQNMAEVLADYAELVTDSMLHIKPKAFDVAK